MPLTQYRISGMTCAACVQNVESVLMQVPGVKQVRVNLVSNSAMIESEGKLSLELMHKELSDFGYDIFPFESDKNKKEESYPLWQVILAIVLSAVVVLFSMVFMHLSISPWVQLFATLPVMFHFGRQFFINAFNQARHFSSNMDTLVSLGTGVAFIYSLYLFINQILHHSPLHEAHYYFEASAVVIAFVLLGRYLEERAKHATGRSMAQLIGLSTNELSVIRDDNEIKVLFGEIRKGDILLLRGGEQVAADGIVLEGKASLNESLVSGESMPLLKQSGDSVISGTIVSGGFLKIRVTNDAHESFVAKVIQTVEKAQYSKAPVQKNIDKITSIFVPIVLIISIITFLCWYFITKDFALAIEVMVSVLVIACPCGLGLATPTALIAGLGKATEFGILVKNAEAFEKVGQVNAIVLDKTGTITQGKPAISGQFFAGVERLNTELPVIAKMASLSDHPFSKLIAEDLAEYTAAPMPSHFEEFAGEGLRAEFDGQSWLMGKMDYLLKNGLSIPEANWWKDADPAHNSHVAFATEGKMKGVFIFTDPLKENAKEAVNALQAVTRSIHMLSGDNEETVKKIAEFCGIQHYRGNVMPYDKYEYVKELQSKGLKVLMAGDGINDAPALVQADLSVAMGGGTDLAMETSDMVLLQGDISRLVKAIQVTRATYRIIRQNLFWAFAYNVFMIPLAAGLFYLMSGKPFPPMYSGIAMAMSSVTVVLNSLRLRYLR